MMNTDQCCPITIKLIDGTSIEGTAKERDFRHILDPADMKAEPFLVVFNPRIEGHSGQVCFVNKNRILYIANTKNPG